MKTLKEIPMPKECYEQLRQTAIEWIKLLNKFDGKRGYQYERNNTQFKEVNEFVGEDDLGVIEAWMTVNWIKFFFNIEEKEAGLNRKVYK